MSDVTRPIPTPSGGPPAEERPGEEATAADLTTPIVVERDGVGRYQLVLALVAIGAAAFLIGLLIGTTTKSAQDDSGDVVTAEVGRAGRTIRFSGGLMVIPRNALTRRVQVTVTTQQLRDRLRVDDVQDEGTTVVVEPGELRAYRFGPADLTFRKPVEITFRLPRSARRATLFARDGDRTTLLRGTIDHARGTATLRVRDFRFDR